MVTDGQVFGHDFVGSKFTGTAVEDEYGSIDFDVTMEVKPGVWLVQGTGPYSIVTLQSEISPRNVNRTVMESAAPAKSAARSGAKSREEFNATASERSRTQSLHP
jgi:hypothetical protein